MIKNARRSDEKMGADEAEQMPPKQTNGRSLVAGKAGDGKAWIMHWRGAGKRDSRGTVGIRERDIE